MKYFLSVALTMIGLFITICVSADTYKWNDDRGIPQYTDKPPAEGIPYEVIDGDRSTNEKPSSQQSTQFTTAGSPEEEQREMDQKNLEELAAKDRDIRKQNCTNAQSNFKTLQEHSRVRVKDENGEYRYLTEEEHLNQLNDSREIIKQDCE